MLSFIVCTFLHCLNFLQWAHSILQKQQKAIFKRKSKGGLLLFLIVPQVYWIGLIITLDKGIQSSLGIAWCPLLCLVSWAFTHLVIFKNIMNIHKTTTELKSHNFYLLWGPSPFHPLLGVNEALQAFPAPGKTTIPNLGVFIPLL